MLHDSHKNANIAAHINNYTKVNMKFYLLFDYQGKNLEFIGEKSSYGLIVKKSPIGGVN